jgi:small subunit ribosomal protein S4
MGAPRRNKKKYEKPKEMWSNERISSDGAFVKEYGLKNMKELWMMQTELSRIRRNARELLSGSAGSERQANEMIKRLVKFGITRENATLDDLLDLNEKSLLERRLQSVVMRKGLARTMAQSRQLIVHGFISINGVRVNRPGYRVSLSEEGMIGYYKPIDITVSKVAEAPAAPVDGPQEQQAESAQNQ